MAKILVAVLFGGISSEHEVSKMSAASVMENFDKEKFEVIPVEISKDGKFDEEKVKSADVVFPCLHGKGGEDGSIQTYLESIHKPYIGPGPEASKLALNKIESKKVFKNLHLPIPVFQFFTKKEGGFSPAKFSNNILPPVFIKPANTGSSVGISRVDSSSKIDAAVKDSLQYEDDIIVEEALDDIREIEVAVMGNDKLTISVPGEAISADPWYTYDAKYFKDSKLVIPAKLSKEKVQEIKDLAERAYRALGCRGMSRVDFFMEKPEGKIYLNEINTIPGFTKTSMYPKLMEASGIPYKELLTRLVGLAMEK
jgi:D-alanine-D-alanine ligase